MKCTLLSIGDELLIGQTLNTNAHWMSQKMNEIGIDVIHHISLSDDEKDIVKCLNDALASSQVVLITGGLGPTSDDITKDVLCAYFGGQLIYNEAAFQNIENIYKLRNRAITDDAKKMSLVPDNCIVIENSTGTAPGMLFRKDEKVIVSMPGVPYEMKAMITNSVIPYLQENFQLPTIIHKSILTVGIGETILAENLKDFEQTKDKRIKLAYLPSVGKVRLRLTIKGENKEELKAVIDKATEIVVQANQEHIYGFDDDVFEEKIGELLLEKKLTIGTAESCTGGYIAHLITSVAGSSAYFKGSIVSYANEVKEGLLHVKEETLAQFGAVSEQTVSEMLSGALEQLKTDIIIAVSGVAGPSGGTPEKPVGTVFIGIANKEKQYIKKLSFTNNRERNIQLSAIVSLVMLRKFLLNL
ncbi:MAG: competence/damage-inducible protein A [Chitinophagales bacterium]